MSCAFTCDDIDYCYRAPGPITACNPCVPCVGTPSLLCSDAVPVAARIDNTACTAWLSVQVNDLEVLNAQAGPLTPAVVQFVNCDELYPPVQINGALLRSWVDPLTPLLARLGTRATEDVANVRRWDDLTTCDPLPLVLQQLVTLRQQLLIVVTADPAKNLGAGDLVIMTDITAGWGDVGSAELLSVALYVMTMAP
jgi:hypothetical protein